MSTWKNRLSLLVVLAAAACGGPIDDADPVGSSTEALCVPATTSAIGCPTGSSRSGNTCVNRKHRLVTPSCPTGYTYESNWVCGANTCCGNGACEAGETSTSCPADCPVSTCTSIDGTFTINGGTSKPLYTVNTGLAHGTLSVTMACPAGTSYSWTLSSGACASMTLLSNGSTMTCQLAASSAATFYIVNNNNPGVTATRTFVAN